MPERQQGKILRKMYYTNEVYETDWNKLIKKLMKTNNKILKKNGKNL
jgi:hypothetical protein